MAKKTKKKSGLGIWFLFALILLAALVLRLYQPDWYADRQFHPDERWIVGNAVPGLNYPDKPIGLQYGSLPLYILSFYKNFLNDLRNNGWAKNMDTNRELIKGARVISGLVDTGTIVFIFLTAMLLFGPKPALFASALLAFTPLHIHASHFFTVDTFTGMFIAGMVYFSARILKYGTLANYITAAVFFGAALASKTSASPAALVIFAAHLLNFFSIKGRGPSARDDRFQSWINLACAAVISLLAFFAFMPHAFLSFSQFMADNDYQRRILVTGEGDVPYNRQYLNTAPYLYYMYNMVNFTMGIPLGVISLFAFFFYIFSAIKGAFERKLTDKGVLILLAWAVPYFAIVGASFGKFNRYMLIFTPFIVLLGAKFIYDFEAWVKEKKWAGALKIVVLAGAVFYGLAFMNVYTNSHTWIQASRWIYANVPELQQPAQPAAPQKKGAPQPVPKRTTILNEMWGDDLPVYADNKGSWIYNITKWNVQEPDNPNKFNELSMSLSEADYVAMADRRAYGTYLRLPKRYPINYFYFSTMFTDPEKLGFKLVYEKAVYPSLFGIDIKDEKGDESFQLYDHPHVYVFRNEKRMTVEELRAVLVAGEQEIKSKFGGEQSGRKNAPQKGMNNPNMGQKKDSPVAILPQLSVFMWYLMVQLLAFMAMPLHFSALSNLRDKGYGLAKATGIFVFAWVNWILVSSGALKFTQATLWALFAVLAAGAGAWYYMNKKQVSAYIKENARHMLFTEIAFLGAYLFFVAIKLWCPDIHNVMGHGYNGGGEPMGMAYLSALFNDVKFPPHDPWLAGFTLNYYYWGQLMLATVAKILGIFPRVAYNLSLSLLFALCFVSAFSVAYNMTGKYRYALFGGFLLALSGNFHTMLFALERLVNSNGLAGFLGQLGVFQFIWDPTRIYPSPVITELPFFSYLYGDLHAHNIVIPVTVLTVALVYNFVKAENKTAVVLHSLGPDIPSRILSAAMIALGTGSMMAINTWNFPGVLLLVVSSLLMAAFVLMRDNLKLPKRVKPGVLAAKAGIPAGLALAGLLVIAGAAMLFFKPFHDNFQSPYGSRLIPVSKPERASAEVMFRYFSVFFIVIFTYMFYVLGKGAELVDKKARVFGLKMRRFDIEKLMGHFEGAVSRIFRNSQAAARFIVACSVAAVSAVFFMMEPSFGFLFIMASVCLWVLFTTKDKDELFSMLLLLMSLGIIWGTELVSIGDGRMNTVFKMYMVAWTFLSLTAPYMLYKALGSMPGVFKKEKSGALISAGAGLAYLAVIITLRFIEARTGNTYTQAFFMVSVILAPLVLVFMKDRIGKHIFAGALVLILVPALLYPLFGAFTKMNICSLNFKRGPEIDGMKYMETIAQRQGSPRDFDKYDYQAMDWINKNLKEITPILEAPGFDMYSGVSRISIFTGMPTLVGWQYQVGQQSGRSEATSYGSTAAAIYSSLDPDFSKDAMKKHGIKYYYIGNIEKNLYPGCEARLALLGEPVYTNGVSTLFKLKD